MKVYFLFVFCLMYIFNVASQNLVDITTHGGSGYAYTITPTVVSTNYTGVGKGIGWSANLYLKSEMGPVNTLNSLRFMVDKDPSTAGKSHFISNCKIYLFHYGSNTQFISLARPDLVALNAVKVFEGDITINNPSSGVFCESQILFSTSFSYDGVSSLGVYLERTEPYAGDNISISPYWGFIDDTDASKLRHLSDWYGTVSNPLAANSIVYPSVGRNRRYAQIKFNDVASPTCGGSSVVPAVPIGASNQSFCSSSNPKISDLVVTGSSGSTIKWYNASSGGTLYSSPSTTALVNNTIYYASQTLAGVESTSRKAITVSIIDPTISPSTSASQSFCSSTNPTVANLVANVSVGSLPKWYQTSSSTSALLSTVALTNGSKYYATAATSGSPACESSSRFEVTVSISTSAIVPTGDSQQTFCTDANPKVSDLKTTSGSSLLWYDASSGGNVIAPTVLLVNGNHYYATVSGCESPSRLDVQVLINTSPLAPTTVATQDFCAIENKKVSDLSSSGVLGAVISWYGQATAGSVAIDPTSLLTTGMYYATQTVGICESPKSIVVNVTVNDPAKPTTTNTSQTFCSIDSKKVLDLSATGTTLTWYNASTSGTAYANTDLLVSGTYYATQTVGSCESANRLAVAVSVNNPLAPTTTNASQSFCSIDAKKVSDLSATGTTLTWYNASTSGTAYANTDLLVSGTYYATQTVGSCESINRLAVSVTVNDPLAPTTSSTTQTFCAIENKKVSDLSASGTDLTWYNASTSGTAYANTDLLVSGTYYASQKVGSCESVNRLAVSVIVNDPSAPTTTNTNQSFCFIESKKVSDLSATGTDLTWYNAPTSGTAYANTDLLASGTYYASQTVGSCESDTRLIVNVTVNNPLAPTTTNTTQTFCASNKPLVSDLQTTSGTNIKWYKQISGSAALASNVELENGNYYATQTETSSGCESTSRLTVTVVLTNPAKPTTSNTTQSFCASKSPKISDLTTDPSGTVKWYSQSVPNGLAFTSTDALTDNTHYYATQTTGTPACESTSTLDVLVNITADPIAPTGSISQSFCATNSPKVSDLKTATGTTIKWYDAATSTSVLDPATSLLNGSHYYATQTTNVAPGCESTSRFDVAVTVTTSPYTPTGNSQQTFCSVPDPKVADLKTTSGSSIIWYEFSTGGSPLAPTTSLVHQKHYFATESGCESVTRLNVEVLIKTTPSEPTTTKSSQSYCSIDNKKVSDLLVDGSTGSTINWYDAATLGTVFANNASLISGKYYSTQTVLGCESSTRLEVNVSIADPSAPTVTSNTESFCSISNPKVSDLTTTTGQNIKWYDQSNLGSAALVPTTPLSTGIYYSTQTVNGCESANRLHVNVSISDPSAPTTLNASQSFCSIVTKKVQDISASGSSLTWYDALTAGTAYANTDLLESKTYYATQKAGSCESDTRLKVEVTVNDPLAPTTTNASQSFCSINTKKVSDLSASGSSLTWYNAQTSGTAYLSSANLVSGKYYATQKVGLCESDTRLLVTVTVNDPLAPTTTNTSQSYCSINNKKVSDLSATGESNSTITWYNAPTSGTAYLGSANLVSGKYYATQKVGSCESATRLEIIVTVNDPLAPTTTNSNQYFCSIDNKQVSDLLANGSLLTWYDASVSGTAYSSGAYLTSGIYYATQKVGLCESDTRLSVTVDVSDPARPTTTITTQSFCSIDNKIVSDLSATGESNSTITWYNDLESGTAYLNSANLVSGKYYASQKVGSCESDTRLEVTVTINDPLAPTTTNASQSFCSIDSKKVSDLSANGSLLTWYDAAVSGTAYSSSAPLVSGTYYASQKVGLCESKNRLVVDVKISNSSIVPNGYDTQYFCLNLNPKISDLVANGTAIKWYNLNTGGTALNSSDALTDKTHYFATQTKNGECESSLRLDVIAYLSNISLEINSQVKSHCGKSDGIVTVLAKEGIGTYDYSWDNQQSNTNVLSNIGIGQFVANVKDSVGCKSTVSFEQLCESTIPQVITPNGNGKNETWVLNLDAKSNLKIFNRWGSVVFSASPYMDDWIGQTNEGTTFGKGFLPSGTYFYTIDKKDGEKPVSGFIELIR